MKLITRRDLIIVLCLLLAGIIGAAAMRPSDGGGRLSAVIYADGTEIRRLELSTADDEVFSIDGLDNVSFEIKNGAIRIASSDCPDGICVSTGFISSPYQSAVCLPKKLYVTIEGKPTDDGADLTVG